MGAKGGFDVASLAPARKRRWGISGRPLPPRQKYNKYKNVKMQKYKLEINKKAGMGNQWLPFSTPADIQKIQKNKIQPYKNTNVHKVIRQLFPVTSPLSDGKTFRKARPRCLCLFSFRCPHWQKSGARLDEKGSYQWIAMDIQPGRMYTICSAHVWSVWIFHIHIQSDQNHQC